MEFERFRTLSLELSENIAFLEKNLRDTTAMLYSSDDDCEGIKLLRDLYEKWEKVCNELEEANKKDEVEIQEICQDFKTTESYFHDLEEKLKEYENFLLQNSLLVFEPNELQSNTTSPIEMSKNDETPVIDTFLNPLISQITMHSTPDLNEKNMVHLEDTMNEFQ